MMTDRFALDTNVLIYLHDDTAPEKIAITKNLLVDYPKIPSQVISEYLNTCKRILKLDKFEILLQAAEVLQDCSIIEVLPSTLRYAADLTLRYKFQMYDAVIVAAAIEGNCKILYSEDMQHSLVVDKRLKIINPFL